MLKVTRKLVPSFVVCLLGSWRLVAAPSLQGIHNFYQVDDQVYRGGQPSAEGFAYLAKIGVKTIVDLREANSRSANEKQTVLALGMKYVNVPMTGLTPPTDAQIVEILGLMENTAGGPVFVHCMRGADRTGSVVAAYRIDHDHWDNAKALKEAMSCGMSFFQLPRQNYIRKFQPLTDGGERADATTREASPVATVASAATVTQ